MRKIKAILATILFLAAGCAHCKSPLLTSRATTEYITLSHKDLISLPPPANKISVAVYNFNDQTGQYKGSVDSSTTNFSTAVTQGAASILIKALQDSGYFTVFARTGLSDLLTERKIIRSSREEVKEENKFLPPLPPLNYASILIEGGIIGYETNTHTGGLGAKYFGAGGSVEFRQDQVAVNLRVVSVKNGAILNSVTTVKSIFSRSLGLGLYRLVDFKRLLEAETGITSNEPVTMCVKEAIERAVLDMIIEGIIRGDWDLKNPEDIKTSPVIRDYLLKEKNEEEESKRKAKLIKPKPKPNRAKTTENNYGNGKRRSRFEKFYERR